MPLKNKETKLKSIEIEALIFLDFRFKWRCVHKWASYMIKSKCLDKCLDMCTTEQLNIIKWYWSERKDCETSFDTFWYAVFGKTQHCASATPLIFMWLSCILNWTVISRVKFEDVKDIKKNLAVQLHTISKEKFHGDFNQWKNHRNKCIKCQGDYLEEN